MGLLRAMRAIRGLNQAKLGAIVNRSQQWASDVETGRLKPSTEQGSKIAKVLDVDPEILFPEGFRESTKKNDPVCYSRISWSSFC